MQGQGAAADLAGAEARGSRKLQASFHPGLGLIDWYHIGITLVSPINVDINMY